LKKISRRRIQSSIEKENACREIWGTPKTKKTSRGDFDHPQ